ncbi:MaoC family dehydratase [Natrinema pallidum]|uniref:MaoC domain protein dehydratase n=2 Tax=Natrinema pallidum TaxID=69527 RepID=L9YE20_9EURY|nr:MaoC family dehydratase [Natrinema pallidum]ELY72339.1 MaoC domain protein dehydratase [Natrinema pallidum DSM 3751]QCW05198.1 MaoC family dehydratase [Natrinema pallidum]
MRYFEDIEVGSTEEFGEYHVTKAEITEFAEQYDPQPFHTDEDAASESAFGELVASGWHTAAISMRLLVDNYLEEQAGMGGRSADELRWERPVTPGETLSLRLEVVDKHCSERDPQRGYVDNYVEVVNQDDEVVLSYTVTGMIERRKNGE